MSVNRAADIVVLESWWSFGEFSFPATCTSGKGVAAHICSFLSFDLLRHDTLKSRYLRGWSFFS